MLLCVYKKNEICVCEIIYQVSDDVAATERQSYTTCSQKLSLHFHGIFFSLLLSLPLHIRPNIHVRPVVTGAQSRNYLSYRRSTHLACCSCRIIPATQHIWGVGVTLGSRYPRHISQHRTQEGRQKLLLASSAYNRFLLLSLRFLIAAITA
jgi:hypothetical protein